MFDRRAFLKGVAEGIATLAAGESAFAVPAPEQSKSEDTHKSPKMRGVNLGGWLVTEKWMKPSLYAGLKAQDEHSFCLELGKEKATSRLKKHRETWITASDFKWIAAHGLNSVRIPVGYWIAEENTPFISGWDTLDWAFRTAKQNGIGVLLDLHGVPGSQNGWDHSGRAGELNWHKSPENIAHSLRVIEELALRCKAYSNLIGFELLNEPRWDVPMNILQKFYKDGYARVRQHLGQEKVAVVIHDGFRPFDWSGFMKEPEYANVILDTHLYQCYTDEDHKRDAHAQIERAAVTRKQELDKMAQQLPCIIGEWSCALNPQSLNGLKGFALDTALRGFGAAQLLSYETTKGWFFWNYKIESGGGWSFRDCVKNGWLPDKFGG